MWEQVWTTLGGCNDLCRNFKEMHLLKNVQIISPCQTADLGFRCWLFKIHASAASFHAICTCKIRGLILGCIYFHKHWIIRTITSLVAQVVGGFVSFSFFFLPTNNAKNLAKSLKTKCPKMSRRAADQHRLFEGGFERGGLYFYFCP